MSSTDSQLKPTAVPAVHLHCGEAVLWLRTLPAECVDLMICDPPYESLEKHRSVGTTTRLKASKSSSNTWFAIFPDSKFPEFFEQAYRVLKPNTHLYVHVDATTMFVVKPMAEAAGFRFWKPLVWDKMTIGMGYHYRARYEFILFFEKGKRRLNSLAIPDVLQHKRVTKGYPTEKPVSLARVLVEQSSNPGELVCDPFMGSGTTGLASIILHRNFTGNDLAADAFDLASNRIVHAGGLLAEQLTDLTLPDIRMPKGTSPQQFSLGIDADDNPGKLP